MVLRMLQEDIYADAIPGSKPFIIWVYPTSENTFSSEQAAEVHQLYSTDLIPLEIPRRTSQPEVLNSPASPSATHTGVCT